MPLNHPARFFFHILAINCTKYDFHSESSEPHEVIYLVPDLPEIYFKGKQYSRIFLSAFNLESREMQFGDDVFLKPSRTPYELSKALVSVLNDPKSYVMSAYP